MYDAAFSWDRGGEAGTFLQVAGQLLGRPPRSVVELACGTGPMARRFAALGLTAFGVDRNPWALERGRSLGLPMARRVRWRLADLRSFRLPVRVEVAVLPLDGVTYLPDVEDLRAFFASTHAALRPGGVLLLDATLTPPRVAPRPFRHRWTVRLLPRGRLSVEWRSGGRLPGTLRRRAETARLTVFGDGLPRRTYLEGEAHCVLSAEELYALAVRNGPFANFRVYSGPAHALQGSRLRVLRRYPRVGGTHLVALWG